MVHVYTKNHNFIWTSLSFIKFGDLNPEGIVANANTWACLAISTYWVAAVFTAVDKILTNKDAFWFDEDVSNELMKKYENFPDEFQKMKFDKTIRRQGLRSQTPYNVSDEEKSSSESETDDEEPIIIRKSNRNKKKVIRYKP